MKLKIVCFLSLFLPGCLTLKDAPITHLYVVDNQNQVCSKRVITDKETLASRRIEELPLEACDGIIGLTAKEFLDLRTYLKGDKNASKEGFKPENNF